MSDARPTPTPWTDRVVEAGTLFLLVFTPLAFGTVEPWSEAIAELVVLGIVVAWVVGMVSQWDLRVELPPGWLPAVLFLALVLVQAVPLPAAQVKLLSPAVRELYAAASEFTNVGSTLVPFSLFPHATWREGLKLLSVAVFFLVLYNVYRTRVKADRALWAMILTSSAVALFGIVQRMTWNGRLYWIGPEAPHSEVFGPFVNRTHFVGLVLATVPMALAMVVADQRRRKGQREGRTLAQRLREWNSQESGPTRLVSYLILLMGSAALVSSSRGAVVSLLAALLCMTGLAAGGRSGGRRVVRLVTVIGLVVLAGAWVGGDIFYGTVERFAEAIGGPGESGRLTIWSSAVALWQQAPVVGTGLASFGSAFPIVRSLAAPVAFGHAESDWVQLFTDTGVLGLGLALAAVGTVGLALFKRARSAQGPQVRSFALAGFVALLGAVVQGVANFNLAVTSSLVYLAAAVALALRRSG